MPEGEQDHGRVPVPLPVLPGCGHEGLYLMLGQVLAGAYRLLVVATCQIDQSGDRYICHLHPTANIDQETLRGRFLALVTDENVRENLRARTEPVRNLILSLAFGSLAEKSEH